MTETLNKEPKVIVAGMGYVGKKYFEMLHNYYDKRQNACVQSNIEIVSQRIIRCITETKNMLQSIYEQNRHMQEMSNSHTSNINKKILQALSCEFIS